MLESSLKPMKVPRRGSSTVTERKVFWQDLLERQKISGLSMKAFCDAQGLHYPDFLRWKTKLIKSKASSAEPKPAPNFIPVELISRPAPTISLHIGQRLRLELPLGCEPKWLHQLMKLLME